MTEKKERDTCPYCGHQRDFGVWVFAHWDELLNTKCEKCGGAYSVRRGIAIKTGRKMADK